ncbi:phage portal protein [Amycolatopsis dendrobii]|uniref:Phage portal protein n=1 Tax=Amycolatopsis dendrobii TaxID=2760662 RepID=A0A7W3ZAN2_9PSEU|nr:phage portal protein [Amycolatopsis dendrobii]MBB1153989.1 phage portal protein [Amycolatopsis dendrobii]
MDPETQNAVATLNKLALRLYKRQKDVVKFDEYYRGERGKLNFASDQFAEYFSQRYHEFSDNWCGVVADAPNERLKVTGFRLVNPDGGVGKVDKEFWRVWRANEADYFSDQAFLEAIIGKRAYGLVWNNPEDEKTPRITFEHPGQAIVSYDPETNRRRAGLKLWVDEDTELEYATLYTPKALWKFQRRQSIMENGRTENGLYVIARSTLVGGWEPREVDGEPWPLPNPLGEVPLVELPNRPRLLGPPLSDLAGVAAMQDAINLMWAYLLNAADYASFVQRVILGAEKPKVPILDDQGQVVGEREVDLQHFAVDRVVWLEDPNAKIGEWKPTPLDIYTGVIDTSVSHVSAQSRTPPHYLMSKIVNANAETLKTAETGLVKRTEEKTESYGRGVREINRLCALVTGDAERAVAIRGGATLWKDVEIRSEAQAVDAAQKLWAMGYPLEYISRRIGMEPDEIAEVLEMKRREIEMDPTAAIARQMADRQPPGQDSTGGANADAA